MEITVGLSGELLWEARELARRERTTLSELVETALRDEVTRRMEQSRFVLEDASVDGRGPRPEFRGARWERIRDAISRPLV